jgi:restriction system protein
MIVIWGMTGYLGVGFVVVASCTVIIAALLERSRRVKIARAYLRKAVEIHGPALKRNLTPAIKRDDYGGIIKDGRDKALVDFVKSIGVPEGLLNDAECWQIVNDCLDVQDPAVARRDINLAMIPANGHDFEVWVTDILRRQGWTAKTTPAGADQGTDIIASKSGHSMGLQCKLYSSPVGNKAVQETIVGMKYHGLYACAVISNAGFTQSARNLAASADVTVLSVEDLADPDAKLIKSHIPVGRPAPQPNPLLNELASRPPSPFRAVR